MFSSIRYAEKIVSLDGGTTIMLPTYLYEFQDTGPLRSGKGPLAGQSYGFDHLRNAIAPREFARSSIRFGIGEDSAADADTFIDQLRSTLVALGPFWLYTLGADGTRRRARCRIAQVADILVTYKRSVNPLASLTLDRYTDWYSDTLTTYTQVITATPTTFTWNNPGGLPADELTIRFRANASNFFTNPHLENLTNGYGFQSTRDGANANSELRLDTATPAVRWSTDDGTTYADDIANLVMPTLEVPLAFQLQPGDNNMRYTDGGTPGLNIEISFYAKWV